ncbi:MAG: PKD domain-containing protein [Haloferacaceae archaeon]
MGGSGAGASAGPGRDRRGRRAVAALAVAAALLLAASLAGPAAVGPERGDVAVRSVTTNAPVLAGDPLVATAVVENRGARPATVQVRLVVGSGVNATRVHLGPGERATVRLRWATDAADAGGHAVAVEADGTRAAARATVVDGLVASCREFDEPGVYALDADVGARRTSPCLSVTADDVTLVGGGHAVDGGGAPGAGVRVAREADDATVRGLVVRGWATGVAVAGDGATVRAVTATNNADRGVALVGGDGALVADARLSNNGDGLALADADGAVARNLTVANSDRHGVATEGNASAGGRLVNVTVAGSAGAGVDADAAVGLRGRRVRLDGAALSFVATRSRLARGNLSDRPPLPADATTVGPAVAVETVADGGVTLTLRYGDRAAGRVVEPTVAAWRHDGGVWTPAGGRVDAAANALTADVGGDGVVVAAGEYNDPPAVSVTTTPERAGVGRRVTVDASNTTDPEGRGIATYAWDLDGDGRVDRRTRAPRVIHTYGTTGRRAIGVSVTDVDGATSATVVDVAVVAVPDPRGATTTDGASRRGPGRTDGTPGTAADRTATGAPTTATDGSPRGLVGDDAGAVVVLLALLALVAVLVRGRRRGR